MRKILVATPLKGGVDEHYVKLLFELISNGIPDCQFGFCFVSNTAINLARNEIVMHMLMNGFTELLFWDKDIRPTIDQFIRLISRQEDVVCGLYSLRRKDTGWHMHMLENKVVNPETGLLRVRTAAIGFSKIKASVFEKLIEDYPERSAIAKDNGRKERAMHDFFPMGIIGPNSTEGRMKAIKDWVKEVKWTEETVESLKSQIETLVHKKHPDPSFLLGEDFYFCKLCFDSGIPIHLDTHLVIPHVGECEFPIPTPELEAMLKEDWRIAQKKAEEELELASVAN